MVDRHKEEFLLAKEKILDNLETLQERLNECSEQGFDRDNFLYDELLVLIDETEDTDLFVELGEIVQKAKSIEHNIDVWLSSRGSTSYTLSWPARFTRYEGL